MRGLWLVYERMVNMHGMFESVSAQLDECRDFLSPLLQRLDSQLPSWVRNRGKMRWFEEGKTFDRCRDVASSNPMEGQKDCWMSTISTSDNPIWTLRRFLPEEVVHDSVWVDDCRQDRTMEAGLCNTFTGHLNIKEHKVIIDITRFNNKSQMIIQIPGKTSKFFMILENFQVSLLPTGHFGSTHPQLASCSSFRWWIPQPPWILLQRRWKRAQRRRLEVNRSDCCSKNRTGNRQSFCPV